MTKLIILAPVVDTVAGTFSNLKMDPIEEKLKLLRPFLSPGKWGYLRVQYVFEKDFKKKRAKTTQEWDRTERQYAALLAPSAVLQQHVFWASSLTNVSEPRWLQNSNYVTCLGPNQSLEDVIGLDDIVAGA